MVSEGGFDASTRLSLSFDKPSDIGKIVKGAIVILNHLAEVDRRTRDSLVLAELTIGRLQIVEIEAAKFGSLRSIRTLRPSAQPKSAST